LAPFKFLDDNLSAETIIFAASISEVCVFLAYTILGQYKCVTDRQMDG